jgi:isopentenyl diphosphate isomerase/L-lactate dehydrogenase-like FMN-dependent dehydrogenase
MLNEESGDFLTLHELVKKAKQRLNADLWDYLAGGTETETTLRRNRMALDSVAFRPRVLNDVSKIDASSTLFGLKLRIPVLLAPIGSLESFEEGGGATAAKAAHAFGTINIQSSVSKPGLEETAKAAPNPKIFQLYVRGDDSFVDGYMQRAIDAGYVAFCFTVDTAVYSRRERDIAKRYVKPWRQRVQGIDHQAGLTWKHILRARDKFKIPIILKGIATAEDAKIAAGHGIEAVYVSNHGGRQLDHGRGALDVLPEVVEAVAGRSKIIIDGGFQRGSDVIKAIALGADAVAVGRMLGWGLAAAGEAGVVRMLELFEIEMRECLGLLGCSTLSELTRAHLHMNARLANPASVFSSFPLLHLSDSGY